MSNRQPYLPDNNNVHGGQGQVNVAVDDDEYEEEEIDEEEVVEEVSVEEETLEEDEEVVYVEEEVVEEEVDEVTLLDTVNEEGTADVSQDNQIHNHNDDNFAAARRQTQQHEEQQAMDGCYVANNNRNNNNNNNNNNRTIRDASSESQQRFAQTRAFFQQSTNPTTTTTTPPIMEPSQNRQNGDPATSDFAHNDYDYDDDDDRMPPPLPQQRVHAIPTPTRSAVRTPTSNGNHGEPSPSGTTTSTMTTPQTAPANNNNINYTTRDVSKVLLPPHDSNSQSPSPSDEPGVIAVPSDHFPYGSQQQQQQDHRVQLASPSSSSHRTPPQPPSTTTAARAISPVHMSQLQPQYQPKSAFAQQQQHPQARWEMQQQQEAVVYGMESPPTSTSSPPPMVPDGGRRMMMDTNRYPTHHPQQQNQQQEYLQPQALPAARRWREDTPPPPLPTQPQKQQQQQQQWKAAPTAMGQQEQQRQEHQTTNPLAQQHQQPQSSQVPLVAAAPYPPRPEQQVQSRNTALSPSANGWELSQHQQQQIPHAQQQLQQEYPTITTASPVATQWEIPQQRQQQQQQVSSRFGGHDPTTTMANQQQQLFHSMTSPAFQHQQLLHQAPYREMTVPLPAHLEMEMQRLLMQSGGRMPPHLATTNNQLADAIARQQQQQNGHYYHMDQNQNHNQIPFPMDTANNNYQFFYDRNPSTGHSDDRDPSNQTGGRREQQGREQSSDQQQQRQQDQRETWSNPTTRESPHDGPDHGRDHIDAPFPTNLQHHQLERMHLQQQHGNGAPNQQSGGPPPPRIPVPRVLLIPSVDDRTLISGITMDNHLRPPPPTAVAPTAATRMDRQFDEMDVTLDEDHQHHDSQDVGVGKPSPERRRPVGDQDDRSRPNMPTRTLPRPANDERPANERPAAQVQQQANYARSAEMGPGRNDDNQGEVLGATTTKAGKQRRGGPQTMTRSNALGGTVQECKDALEPIEKSAAPVDSDERSPLKQTGQQVPPAYYNREQQDPDDQPPPLSKTSTMQHNQGTQKQRPDNRPPASGQQRAVAPPKAEGTDQSKVKPKIKTNALPPVVAAGNKSHATQQQTHEDKVGAVVPSETKGPAANVSTGQRPQALATAEKGSAVYHGQASKAQGRSVREGTVQQPSPRPQQPQQLKQAQPVVGMTTNPSAKSEQFAVAGDSPQYLGPKMVGQDDNEQPSQPPIDTHERQQVPVAPRKKEAEAQDFVPTPQPQHPGRRRCLKLLWIIVILLLMGAMGVLAMLVLDGGDGSAQTVVIEVPPTSPPVTKPSSAPTILPDIATVAPSVKTTDPAFSSSPSPTRPNLRTVAPSADTTPKPDSGPSKSPGGETTTSEPLDDLSSEPSLSPNHDRTVEPIDAPSNRPTPAPALTQQPIGQPTATKTSAPTLSTTDSPVAEPSVEPNENVTQQPAEVSTPVPTESPALPSSTNAPTRVPPVPQPATPRPTEPPTRAPTVQPTMPTLDPVLSTKLPTLDPTAIQTNNDRTSRPTPEETTVTPTSAPTISPTWSPTAPPTSRPTALPTLPPTTRPTIGPTLVPIEEATVAPTEPDLSWQLTGGPFSTGLATITGFGSSIAITDTILAVGARFVFDVGGVLTYTKDSTSNTWSPGRQLFGEQEEGNYGAAIAMAGNALLVGAPYEFFPGTTTQAGAAYYYEYSDGVLNQVGSPIFGDDGIFATDEEFGLAVATNSNRQLVIGAPGNSFDFVFGRGKVYIFSWNGVDFELDQELLGVVGDEEFGTSVDISENGSTIVVGAPSRGFGYASIFELSGDEWTVSRIINGVQANEEMGRTVKILTQDGSLVAVGAPRYDGGAGRVVVYQRGVDGSFSKIGSDISGLTGDEFGRRGSLGGSFDGRSLLVGTTSGLVRRYMLVDDDWIFVDDIDSGLGRDLMSIGVSTDGQVAVAGNEQAAVFALV